jgi:hypothetical protein
MRAGDVERDLTYIRDVYKDTHGRFPELAGEVRFRE